MLWIKPVLSSADNYDSFPERKESIRKLKQNSDYDNGGPLRLLTETGGSDIKVPK